MKNINKESVALHKKHAGKIEIKGKIPVKNRNDLSLAYTPGVGAVCMEIFKDPKKVYDLTIKKNMIAVITDGSAVLGLGNLGPAGDLLDEARQRPGRRQCIVEGKIGVQQGGHLWGHLDDAVRGLRSVGTAFVLDGEFTTLGLHILSSQPSGLPHSNPCIQEQADHGALPLVLARLH